MRQSVFKDMRAKSFQEMIKSTIAQIPQNLRIPNRTCGKKSTPRQITKKLWTIKDREDLKSRQRIRKNHPQRGQLP
jgi:hypothetical protein